MATIVINSKQFKKLTKGLMQVELVKMFSLSNTEIWRVLSERKPPGKKFIAASLAAFPNLTFNDLFKVVKNDNS